MSAEPSVPFAPSSSTIERGAIACAVIGLALLATASLARWHNPTQHLSDEGPAVFTAAPTSSTPRLSSDPSLAASPAAVRELPSTRAVVFERTAATPSPPDPGPRLQPLPYLRAIGAGLVGAYTSATPSVVVAVVDSGVDVTHPDLVGHLWENPRWLAGEAEAPDVGGCPRNQHGCAFVSAATADPSCGYQSTEPSGAIADDNGHGTFVAGVVLAAAGIVSGEIDIAGQVDVRILPVKVLDCAGEGRASQAAAGINYAARSGARIIVLAFSSTSDSPALREAVAEAQETYGALVVAAAGNDGSTEMQFPSGYPGVLAVGGTGVVRADGQVDYLRQAPFSNTGDAIRVLAPAVDIRGPIPPTLCGHRDWLCAGDQPYAYASGTSYAAPLVAGAYAHLIANDPDLTPEQGTRMLIETAKLVEGSPAGLVDFTAALARGRR